MVAIEQQSPDIAQGLHYEKALEELGAGDQGIMFGYATDETDEKLPLTILLAHKLNAALASARRSGSLPWLRPDTKTQVTIEYEKTAVQLSQKSRHNCYFHSTCRRNHHRKFEKRNY